MNIDTLHSDRYHVIDGQIIRNGWEAGWRIFQEKGSPQINTQIQKRDPPPKQKSRANPLDLGLWPDTKDYDQNNPGILKRVEDLDRRKYISDLEKAFWVNVTRVPICASYLAACAKVRPRKILELGTGGDSAHSTGMFLYWLHSFMLEFEPRKKWQESSKPYCLISVDRHPLSHVWPRYRDYPFWNFIQGDSINTMRAIIDGAFKFAPGSFDLIFIDSSHTYPHTLYEIKQASYMTDAILLDDTTVPDVKASLEEFLTAHPEWLRIDLTHGVTLIERHEHIE